MKPSQNEAREPGLTKIYSTSMAKFDREATLFITRNRPISHHKTSILVITIVCNSHSKVIENGVVEGAIRRSADVELEPRMEQLRVHVKSIS